MALKVSWKIHGVVRRLGNYNSRGIRAEGPLRDALRGRNWFNGDVFFHCRWF
jgi:hypothetical protein